MRPEKSDICFGKADKLYNRLDPGALSGLTGGGKRGIIGAESRREAAWGAFPDGGRGKSNPPQRGRREEKMTNRERMRRILHGEPADRLPAVHFGYWPELLQEWAEQGEISGELARAWNDGNEADFELDKRVGWDFNWQTMASGAISLRPPFEEKVLEVLPDGFKRVQNALGLIERVREGAGSIPAEDDWLLKDRAAFEELYRPRMQYDGGRVDAEALRARRAACADRPLGLHLGSVLGDIRSMLSVVGMSYLMYDDPELFAEIVDTYAEMQFRCAEDALASGVDFDFAHYWEDICFKNGPLIAPDLFEEVCARHYKKRNELCRKHGIDLISLDCDGVIARLVPAWFENGVNVMFPLEVGVWGDQFAAFRKTYGPRLKGVGGFDKTCLRKDRAAVDAELERMKALVSLGGFLPCPDHRLMPGSRFDLVCYYAEQIKKMKI